MLSLYTINAIGTYVGRLPVTHVKYSDYNIELLLLRKALTVYVNAECNVCFIF